MNVWVVVPAAGIGQRFQSEKPKQYQRVLGETVLTWTLKKLLEFQPVGVVVAVHPEDNDWQQLDVMKDPRVEVVLGGVSRALSVQYCLAALASRIADKQWVLVHDAARPCITLEDIQNLYQVLEHHPVGGVLATPVSDTLKQVDDNLIDGTINRERLWAALTPQMFRFGLLRQALAEGLTAKADITDEASAMEVAGYKPVVIAGARDNIKITHREDLMIAEAILRYQSGIAGGDVCE